MLGDKPGNKFKVYPSTAAKLHAKANLHQCKKAHYCNGLLISTPRGTFPLKSLFSVTIETDNKETSKSAAAVRNMIRTILSGEKGDKPLSDELIAKIVS